MGGSLLLGRRLGDIRPPEVTRVGRRACWIKNGSTCLGSDVATSVADRSHCYLSMVVGNATFQVPHALPLSQTYGQTEKAFLFFSGFCMSVGGSEMQNSSMPSPGTGR